MARAYNCAEAKIDEAVIYRFIENSSSATQASPQFAAL
jgi:hypothetical protein